MTLPILFSPIYKERVWGGRRLETEYRRTLPTKDTPYGESWEISDRADDQSIVQRGPYKGKTLHELWTSHRQDIFGKTADSERFPVLIKILDASEKLSVQVHPPKELAEDLNGEPKTETWYIADAQPDAKLYVGVKENTTEEILQTALQEGCCEEHIHTLSPKAGEFIHLESGRLHAIGAGLLIYEIQQNSDTTFRVFDWNRIGLSGAPRDLHIEESLQCINFDDVEPTMDTLADDILISCEHYEIKEAVFTQPQMFTPSSSERFSIVTIVQGELIDTTSHSYHAGDFLLMPRGASPLQVSTGTKLLITTIP